jgi:hypothetical protein
VKNKIIMGNIYQYCKETLTFNKINRSGLLLKVIIYTLIIFGLGYLIGYNHNVNYESIHYLTKSELYPINNQKWVDSTFTEYENDATTYLNRPMFSNTPLTGEMLAHCAKNTYFNYNILVPVELALAQCQFESSMGREGRSPKKNPYNLGEYDSGTVIWFNTTQDGVQAYFDLIAKDYLSCKTPEQLLTDFTNCNGKRYASGDYEIHISKQMYYIKKWLKNR